MPLLTSPTPENMCTFDAEHLIYTCGHESMRTTGCCVCSSYRPHYDPSSPVLSNTYDPGFYMSRQFIEDYNLCRGSEPNVFVTNVNGPCVACRGGSFVPCSRAAASFMPFPV